jgi:hypothetical protein
MEKRYAYFRGRSAIAVLLALLLAIPAGGGLAFAAETESSGPAVSYGYAVTDDANDGYLLFDLGVASTTTTSAILTGGAFTFATDIDTDDFDVSGLPKGLSLTDVTWEGSTELTLEFTYNGDGIDEEGYLFEYLPYETAREIGQIDLYITAGVMVDGSTPYEDEVAVPIVAETVMEGKIPFGARLYRELEAEHRGFGDDGHGAVVDYADLAPSPYYMSYDYHDVSGGADSSLDILSGYRTIQQSTGWSCGLAAALTAVDWYGKREWDGAGVHYALNELDLAKLRDSSVTDRDYGGATKQEELTNVFRGLEATYEQDWEYVDGYDLDYDDYGTPLVDVKYDNGGEMPLFDAIPYYIENGIPIIIGWRDWGGHYQVIVGYDDMDTDETTADDVLILADPYDTTDHAQDGFIIQSYERFIWDWSVNFDEDFDNYVFTAAWPAEYAYTPATGGSQITDDAENGAGFNDDDRQLMKNLYYDPIDEAYYDKLVSQLVELNKIPPYEGNIWFYPEEGSLSGPANEIYYRAADYEDSPYYKQIDFYDSAVTAELPTLDIIENFETIQQATEFNCGPTSMLMVMNSFADTGDLTEVDLDYLRYKEDEKGGSTVREMVNIIDNLNDGGVKWDYLSTYDVTYSEYSGSVSHKGEELDIYEEMIPYFVSQGIPVMIMWHEWGGHWQAVIGYDDMGTDGTQDDVIILADPYDTTDHNQNGYMIESFERLVYDWGNSYDDGIDGIDADAFLIMYPHVASGAGGSGGGGGGGGTTPPENSAKEEEKESKENASAAPSAVSVASFTDIASHWAYEAISFVIENGYMKGVSSTEFAPNQTANRGMFVTVLGRIDGVADSDENSPARTRFADVGAQKYFAAHVEWGLENGIVNGLSNDVFGWDQAVTREQAAVFIARYLTYEGVALPAEDAADFADAESISGWAVESVSALRSIGVISGRDDGGFDPLASITRAEMATMLQNLLTYLEGASA